MEAEEAAVGVGSEVVTVWNRQRGTATITKESRTHWTKARREVESLSRRLKFRPEAFDPEKHITKATVCAWLEEDAKRGDRSREAHTRSGNSAAALEAKASASDTHAIIARINTTKESP